MSPNTPYTPDDESNRGAEPHEHNDQQHEPLAGNPYANQQRQAPQPDLDTSAPRLTQNDMRRMNRSALGLLAGKACSTGSVLDGIQCNFNLVAGLDLHLAALIFELLERDYRL